jgi:hypothetical protein
MEFTPEVGSAAPLRRWKKEPYCMPNDNEFRIARRIQLQCLPPMGSRPLKIQHFR